MLANLLLLGCNNSGSNSQNSRHSYCETAGVLCVPEEYSSIADAISNSDNGNTIAVGDGHYYENLILDKEVQLVGNGSSNTFVHGEAGSGSILTVRADAKIDSINISIGDNCIFVDTNIKSIIISNTILSNCSSDGVGFENLENTYVFISDCEIFNCGDGIDIEDSSNGMIRDNNLHDNSDDGLDFDGNVNFVVTGNIMSNNSDDGIEVRLAENSQIQIINNIFENNGEDGLEVIDSYIEGCRSDPSLCNNILYILNNSANFNIRYGFGFVDVETEIDVSDPIALKALLCSGNSFSGNGVSAISPNYYDQCI